MLNTLVNIVLCKCPRCHEGKMFENGVSLNLKKSLKMNSSCAVCGLDLQQETGYYFGAMYVSYAFAIAEMVALLIGLYLFFGALSIPAILAVLTAVFVLLSPSNYRWGRAGWIAIFFKYDRNAKLKNLQTTKRAV